MKTQKAQLRSRSLKSKVQKLVLTWFLDEPAGRRSRRRRSKSPKNPSHVSNPKVLVGCCGTFVFFLVARYLVARYCETSTIPKVYGQFTHPKKHLKPNPDSSNPTDWDQAFIETPLINLKAWAQSFERCLLEQKLSNETSF